MPSIATASTGCSSDASAPASGRRLSGDVPPRSPRLRRLRHGEQLGAWVATIAERVAIDVHRRTRPPVGRPSRRAAGTAARRTPSSSTSPAASPPTERAAVVLRYGYDLDYDQIGAVLGSNAVAARQAASAGVRRLRKELA